MPVFRVISLFFLLLSCFKTGAQTNHVINGDFEYYSGCPIGISMLGSCTNWRQYTSGTSDYYHTCSTNPFYTIPDIHIGYQQPASGLGFIAIFLYVKPNSSGRRYKEYAAGAMQPLIPGLAYRASLSVALANNSNYATDDMGIYFYKDGPDYFPSFEGNVNVIPQVKFSDNVPITDTGDWLRVSGTFIADSAYHKFVIGGFESYDTLTLDTVNNNTLYPHAYYYIDSVVVVGIDTFFTNATDTLLCNTEEFIIDYYAVVNGTNKLNVKNTFTAQLSDATGNFSNPVNIGSISADSAGSISCRIPYSTPAGSGYRIRVVSSAPADTSADNGFDINIMFINKDSIQVSGNRQLCTGDNINLSAATSYPTTAQFVWTGQGGFNSNSNVITVPNAGITNGGNYILETEVYGCVLIDTINVSVHTYPQKPIAGNNSPFCEGQELILTATGDTTDVVYTWQGPSGFQENKQNINITTTHQGHNGTFIVTADNNGCKLYDTTLVVIKPYPEKLNLQANTPLKESEALNLASNSNTAGASYTWTKNDTFLSNEHNYYIEHITRADTGWYIMTADLNDCIITDSVFIETLEKELILYPNPNDGDFTISGSVPSNSLVGITIYNAARQVVYKQTVQPENNLLHVNISMHDLANGIYYLRLGNLEFERSFSFTHGAE